MPSPTIATFLASLPVARRSEVERVRHAILAHLPDGYEEVVSKNMLVYQVPLQQYADTYNGHPLWYVALASEKSYLSLHLMPVYRNEALAGRLQKGFERAGKKLDIGKACLHFKTADDLALDVIGEIVAAIPMTTWIEVARSARSGAKGRAKR
jgi:hypothetical protein